ncbi:BREX-1 system adenine-specific DNA-methyltransferase PglX, partial [Fusobacterium pseudoperiodonticum]
DLELIENLIAQHIALTNKYEAVVTNPPYMGGKGFSTKLKAYVEKNYKDSKSDLFAVFIERCNEFTKKNCYTSMITMQSWMFLSSYETFRKNIIEKTEIKSLNHLGTRAFSEIGGEVVSTVAWVSQKKSPKNDGTYLRLVDYNNADLKEEEFFNKANYFQAKQKDFEKIPGSPIAYWVSDKVREIFEKNKKLGEVGEAKQGLATADNNRFLRLWNEVSFSKIGYNISNSQEALESKKKWFPFNKGGEFRKWYGNQEYLVNWENDGYEIKNFYDEKGKLRSRPQNTEYYFKESVTCSAISSSQNSIRYCPSGNIFDVNLRVYFLETDKNLKLLSILNSKIFHKFGEILSPTLALNANDLDRIPIIFNDDIKLVQQNIDISKEEWDSRETSWDFEKLSLVDGKDFRTAFENYCSHWRDNFVQLHKNEEELNRLFIEIYELQDEMDEKVSFDDITILKKEAKIVEIDNSKAREFSSE